MIKLRSVCTSLIFLFSISLYHVCFSFISQLHIKNIVNNASKGGICYVDLKRSLKLKNSVLDHSSEGLLETDSKEYKKIINIILNKVNNLINRKIKRKKIGRLILVRHGESEMNTKGSFTGWIDSDITEDGRKEMEHAGRLMLERGYTDVDLVYTSLLKRSIRSSWALLKELNQIFRPVKTSWMLNQRMYGALEGLTKEDLVGTVGEDLIQEYRRSLYIRPPPMNENHPYWHRNERKYRDLLQEDIPLTESISDCFNRVIPLYRNCILPDLIAGKNVVIVGHANSLRGIIKEVDSISEQDVLKIDIPNGSPLVYQFDENVKPIMSKDSFKTISGSFLEDRKVLDIMLEKESHWGQADMSDYKGMYSLIDYSSSTLVTPIMQGLSKLLEETEILENFHPGENKLETLKDTSNNPLSPDDTTATTLIEDNKYISSNNIKLLSTIEEPFVVIIRHGKTEYNKLGIFTGWDDAPLAEEGRLGAKKAGQLLKLHGIEFDIVYTSWLSRAIETAWTVLDELDLLWLPIIKTWRLNERMYGKLTGMSKKGIAERFGDKQLKSWRRGYAVQPPAVDSFHPYYPGNDDRYLNYVKDVRVSFFESVIRTLAKGKLEVHRKFPKTESLKDCMTRTIPYFKKVIEPNVKKGNKVLIASSENAIRGLLMDLCDIPQERIHEIDIPNSLPLVYSYKKKCVQILDDGLNEPEYFYNPLGKYNFGESPELLFKPCNFDDENTDQCFIGEKGKSYSFDPIIRLVPNTTNNNNNNNNNVSNNSNNQNKVS